RRGAPPADPWRRRRPLAHRHLPRQRGARPRRLAVPRPGGHRRGARGGRRVVRTAAVLDLLVRVRPAARAHRRAPRGVHRGARRARPRRRRGTRVAPRRPPGVRTLRRARHRLVVGERGGGQAVRRPRGAVAVLPPAARRAVALGRARPARRPACARGGTRRGRGVGARRVGSGDRDDGVPRLQLTPGRGCGFGGRTVGTSPTIGTGCRWNGKPYRVTRPASVVTRLRGPTSDMMCTNCHTSHARPLVSLITRPPGRLISATAARRPITAIVPLST